MQGLDDALAGVVGWIGENLLIDTVRITLPATGDPVLNEDTGQLEYPEGDVLYEGPGGVQGSSAQAEIVAAPNQNLPWVSETTSRYRLLTPSKRRSHPRTPSSPPSQSTTRPEPGCWAGRGSAPTQAALGPSRLSASPPRPDASRGDPMTPEQLADRLEAAATRVGPAIQRAVRHTGELGRARIRGNASGRSRARTSSPAPTGTHGRRRTGGFRTGRCAPSVRTHRRGGAWSSGSWE